MPRRRDPNPKAPTPKARQGLGRTRLLLATWQPLDVVRLGFQLSDLVAFELFSQTLDDGPLAGFGGAIDGQGEPLGYGIARVLRGETALPWDLWRPAYFAGFWARFARVPFWALRVPIFWA